MPLSSALRRTLFVIAVLTLPLAPRAQGFEPLDPALRNVRGVNYVPTYPTLDGTPGWFGVASHTAMWSFFDATTAPSCKQQLQWAKRCGFNTVRVFLSFLCWQYHDEHRADGESNHFIEQWHEFVGLCEDQHIRVLPVLFDFVSLSVPYVEPDYDDPNRLRAPANISFWHDNPGRARARAAYGKDFANLDLGRYVVDCVSAIDQHDADVLLAWDVANEPYVGGDDELGLPSRWFVQQTMALVKRTRPSDRVLVSAGVNDRFPTTLIWANDKNCDVIGIHVYGPNSRDLLAAFVHDATYVNDARTVLGKPVLATEIGNPGGGFSYQDTVRYCRELPRPDLPQVDGGGVGFCTWMLMIGYADQARQLDDHHPFKHGTGLFYGHDDGGVALARDLGAVRTFVELAVEQGIARDTLWFGGTPELDAIAQLPAGHPNFVSPLPGAQTNYGLAQRWVQDYVFTATRDDYRLPGWTWDDYREFAALLRETVHPNLDLRNVVSVHNGNPFRTTTAPCYQLDQEQLARLHWFREASLEGSPAFRSMIRALELRNGIPPGGLRPWDPASGHQERDLGIVFGDFLYAFAQELAPIMLPR
jgi:hypothetical protein